jgi:hypothetical protein
MTYTRKALANEQMCMAFGFCASGIVAALALSLVGQNLVGWAATVLATARVSLLLFILIFSARPLSRVFPALLGARRRLGLTYAGAQGAHLICVIKYLSLGGRAPATLSFAMDIVGYFFITLMMLTSNDLAVRIIGARKWHSLHTIGIYYLWLIYFVTYAARAAISEDAALYDGLLILVIGALVFRFWTGKKSSFAGAHPRRSPGIF